MKKTIATILSILTILSAFSKTRDEEHHILTSDGISLYVHVRGQGEPCLYLHGGPGSGSTWMKEMGGEELEKRFTMVYVDQRGVCRSSSSVEHQRHDVRGLYAIDARQFQG